MCMCVCARMRAKEAPKVKSPIHFLGNYNIQREYNIQYNWKDEVFSYQTIFSKYLPQLTMHFLQRWTRVWNSFLLKSHSVIYVFHFIILSHNVRGGYWQYNNKCWNSQQPMIYFGVLQSGKMASNMKTDLGH